MDLTLNFPFGGRSELLAVSKQAPGTTRRELNCHGVNPVNGRMTGAQRRGLSKFSSQPVVAGARVQALTSIVYDAKALDYAELAPAAMLEKWTANAAFGEAAQNSAISCSTSCCAASL